MHSKKVVAQSAVKMQKWWQKAPLLFKSGGTSATILIIVVEI